MRMLRSFSAYKQWGAYVAPAGALPSKWGRIFPKLQYLLIHSNSLYSEVPGVAQPLPISWTRQTLPLSFQTLQMLVAFPGNDLICQLPATTDDGGEGWTQLQGGACAGSHADHGVLLIFGFCAVWSLVAALAAGLLAVQGTLLMLMLPF